MSYRESSPLFTVLRRIYKDLAGFKDAIETPHTSKREIKFKMASSVLIVLELGFRQRHFFDCSLTEDYFTTVFPCFLCAIGPGSEEEERHYRFDKKVSCLISERLKVQYK